METMSRHSYIACDLGAESGRVILGILENGRLALEEIHRFPNGPVHADGSLRWDVDQLFEELKTGLSRVAARLQAGGMKHAESLSLDAWGVDYVLVNSANAPLTLPYHYRDPRTETAFSEAMKIVPAEIIYAETGIQFMPINTLYQLLAHQKREPEQLAQADHFLLIADYFLARFSGVGRAERSIASTTQLYNPATGQWSEELLSRFALPKASAAADCGLRHGAWAAAPGDCGADRPARHSGDRNLLPRYRRRHRRRAGGRRRLGLSQFRHVVTAGRGIAEAADQFAGTESGLYQ